MAKPDKYSVDRLLAGRPGLSVAEKEAMLARLLDDPGIQARRRPARRWRPLALVGAAGAMAAAAVVLMLPESQPELVPRGGPGHAGLAVSCTPGPCRPGDTLRFRIAAPADRPWFSAFARREDDTVIWYFPEHQSAESVRTQADASWLDRGVRLGPEHTPGRYEVIGVFTREPANRDAVRAIVRGDDKDAVMVETSLEILVP